MHDAHHACKWALKTMLIEILKLILMLVPTLQHLRRGRHDTTPTSRDGLQTGTKAQRLLADGMPLLRYLAHGEPIVLLQASDHDLLFPSYRLSFLFLLISTVSHSPLGPLMQLS